MQVKDPQNQRFLEKELCSYLLQLVRQMKKFAINKIQVFLQKPKKVVVRNFSWHSQKNIVGDEPDGLIFTYETDAERRVQAALQATVSRLNNPLIKERLKQSIRTQWRRGVNLANQQLKNARVPPPPPTKTKEEKALEDTLANVQVDKIKTVATTYLSSVKEWIARYLTGQISYTEMMRQIQSVGRIPEWKVRRIARTETTRTLTNAKKSTYLKAGVTHWVWLTSLDERVCPICQPLHGKTVFIGRSFKTIRKTGKPDVRITQPPAHPNCRCGVAPSYRSRVLTPEEEKRMEDLKWI